MFVVQRLETLAPSTSGVHEDNAPTELVLSVNVAVGVPYVGVPVEVEVSAEATAGFMVAKLCLVVL